MNILSLMRCLALCIIPLCMPSVAYPVGTDWLSPAGFMNGPGKQNSFVEVMTTLSVLRQIWTAVKPAYIEPDWPKPYIPTEKSDDYRRFGFRAEEATLPEPPPENPLVDLPDDEYSIPENTSEKKYSSPDFLLDNGLPESSGLPEEDKGQLDLSTVQLSELVISISLKPGGAADDEDEDINPYLSDGSDQESAAHRRYEAARFRKKNGEEGNWFGWEQDSLDEEETGFDEYGRIISTTDWNQSGNELITVSTDVCYIDSAVTGFIIQTPGGTKVSEGGAGGDSGAGMDSGTEDSGTTDYAFEDKEAPARLACSSCVKLLKEPVQFSCGHRICKACADSILESNEHLCPQSDCQDEITEEDGASYFPDRFVAREIENLQVVCNHCQDNFTYKEIDSHLDICVVKPRILHCRLANYGCSETFLEQEGKAEHEKSCPQLIHMTIALAGQVEKLQVVNRDQSPAQIVQNGCQIIEADSGFPQSYSLHCQPGYSGKQYSTLSKGFSTTSEASITRVVEIALAERKLVPLDEFQAVTREIADLRKDLGKMEKLLRQKVIELEDRDFRLSLIENSNHDGSMIWKIPTFSQRKGDAENGKYTSIFSLPFYSGRYGYKMCLRLYIMGDGISKGTHLSLFFVVMRGEFDNVLQWPFTHKVTFKMINQAGGRDIVDTFQPDPMSSSFRKPKSDMNIASGCPRFISHTELERGGFIVEDTIFIRCHIDTSTIRHP